MESAYKLVDLYEHTGLGVLSRDVVTVDGHPPTLVSAHRQASIQSILEGSELGAQEKDINTTELGDLIQKGGYGRFQAALCKIGNQVAVNINVGAALLDSINLAKWVTKRHMGQVDNPPSERAFRSRWFPESCKHNRRCLTESR